MGLKTYEYAVEFFRSWFKLELRQDDIRTAPFIKKSSNFDIAAIFYYLHGARKSMAISKPELIVTEWSRKLILNIAS